MSLGIQKADAALNAKIELYIMNFADLDMARIRSFEWRRNAATQQYTIRYYSLISLLQ